MTRRGARRLAKTISSSSTGDTEAVECQIGFSGVGILEGRVERPLLTFQETHAVYLDMRLSCAGQVQVKACSRALASLPFCISSAPHSSISRFLAEVKLSKRRSSLEEEVRNKTTLDMSRTRITCKEHHQEEENIGLRWAHDDGCLDDPIASQLTGM